MIPEFINLTEYLPDGMQPMANPAVNTHPRTPHDAISITTNTTGGTIDAELVQDITSNQIDSTNTSVDTSDLGEYGAGVVIGQVPYSEPSSESDLIQDINAEFDEPSEHEITLDEVQENLMEEINSEFNEPPLVMPSDASISETVEEERPFVQVIPDNNDLVLRYSAAPWFDEAKNKKVCIYGLGGTGSWSSIALSRLGIDTIVGIDGDVIESVNMAGQAYTGTDVGLAKAAAVGNIIRNYSPNTSVYTFHDRFENRTDFHYGDVTISAFDNMEARKNLYEVWRDRFCLPGSTVASNLFIDLRMAAETIQIFCFTNIDKAYMEDYEHNWLFSSAEAEHTQCSYKQTTFTGMIIGGLACNLVANYFNNLVSVRDPFNVFERPLPYKTFYDASTMAFNTVV